MLSMYTSPLTDEYLYQASILTAIRQVFIYSFKSNTLQTKLASPADILRRASRVPSPRTWFDADWNTNCLLQLGNYFVKMSLVSQEKYEHSQYDRQLNYLLWSSITICVGFMPQNFVWRTWTYPVRAAKKKLPPRLVHTNWRRFEHFQMETFAAYLFSPPTCTE